MTDNIINTANGTSVTDSSSELQKNGVEKNENYEEYMLVNIYQEIVERNVKSVMESIDMCKCKKCFIDACAIALNKLPSAYVTTKRGALLAAIHEIANERDMEMTVLATAAVRIVKNSPKH